MMFSLKKTAIIIFLSCFIVLSLIIVGLYCKSKNIENQYLIKSYKNTVALYKNGEIIETYDGSIVLNSLPESDIKKFNNGIEIENYEDVYKMLEDYDG